MESPARTLWEDAKHRLRAEIARPLYDSWVRDTEGVALARGEFVILVGNETARAQIAGERSIAQVAGQLAGVDRVRFVTASEWEAELGAAGEPPDEATLQPVYLSRYDEIVRPERAASVPRYYLRLLPYLGLDLAWIPVAFRQVAYFRGLAFEPGDSLQCSIRELALWAGMTRRNLFRRITDPRLGWFVRRSQQDPQWTVGADGIPHRDALTWDVILSMPLTPADQRSLESFLRRRLEQGLTPSQALKAAYQLPLDELLPWPEAIEVTEADAEPQGVAQVVSRVLNFGTDQHALRKLADALAYKIAGYGEPLEISHYFIRTWLPRLSPGEAWLVHYLRWLAAGQGATGEVTIPGGYPALARRLGVTVKTIHRWLTSLHPDSRPLGLFVQKVRSVRHGDRSIDLTLVVRPEEPINPADEAAAGARVGGEPEGHSVTIEDDPQGHSVTYGQFLQGQSVTHGPPSAPREPPTAGAPGGHPVIHGDNPSGHPVTHGPPPQGQSVTHAIQGQGHPVIHASPRETDILSPLKGGGGLSSQTHEHLREESSSSFTGDSLSAAEPDVTHGAANSWDLTRLLQLASVHPVKARELEGASAVAWVSWLLYWASPAGAKLNDPIGHTVSRIREAPQAPMGGPYARLAALGPDELQDLIVPRILNPWGAPPANPDWADAMRGAAIERLRRLVDLLGFDLEAWRRHEAGDWDGDDPLDDGEAE